MLCLAMPFYLLPSTFYLLPSTFYLLTPAFYILEFILDASKGYSYMISRQTILTTS